MIIAGAAEGSVGLRDHIANSFLDFSTGKVADCFVTSGEVMMGDDSSGDGVKSASGGCGTGSGTDTGSDAGSVTGPGVGFRVGSMTASGAGSGTDSGTRSTS